MPKYVVKKVNQLSANETAAVKSINENLEAISDAIEDTVSRSGKLPYAMQASLAMNGNRIINLAEPVDDGDAVRYKDLKEIPSLTEEARMFRNEAEAAATRAVTTAAQVDQLGREYVQETGDNASLSEAWAIADDFDDRLGGESSSKAYSNLAMAIANAPEDVPVSMSDMQSRVIIRGEAFKYEDFTAEQLEALRGPRGFQGVKGDTGSQGIQGPKGDKGDSTYAIKDTIRISVGDWDSSTNTSVKTVSGVKSTSVVWLSPTIESYDAYANAVILGTEQGTNTITFKCKKIPIEDINVEVVVA